MFFEAALGNFDGILENFLSLNRGESDGSSLIMSFLECGAKVCYRLRLRPLPNVSDLTSSNWAGCLTAKEESWVAESLIWVTSPAGVGVVLGRFGIAGVPSIIS